MLKPIVIDGSNVALSHGNNLFFSCKGIRICVEWFKNRGHKDVKVFVPSWRKENSRSKNPIRDQEILFELEREEILVFTPSRWICDKRIICYDDRYILKFAADIGGIVVSNDNYRDIIAECKEFKKVVKEHLLMYSFINDNFMPPDDPLGRLGPSLEEFLKIQDRFGQVEPLCPYGKKCTYGYKCKYRHKNDDAYRPVANHNTLRKTVSAPPYLNQHTTDFAAPPSTSIAHSTPKQFKSYNDKNQVTSNSKECDIKNLVISKHGDESNEVDLKVKRAMCNYKATSTKLCLEKSIHKPLTKTSSAPEKFTRLQSASLHQERNAQRIDTVEVAIDVQRKRMQFHLSNIFPKEHVQSIFNNLPYETDPNILCEALLELNKSSTK